MTEFEKNLYNAKTFLADASEELKNEALLSIARELIERQDEIITLTKQTLKTEKRMA